MVCSDPDNLRLQRVINNDDNNIESIIHDRWMTLKPYYIVAVISYTHRDMTLVTFLSLVYIHWEALLAFIMTDATFKWIEDGF